MNRTIEEQIEDMRHYMDDPRMDGFSQFEKKKRIYKILWRTQRALKYAPTFTGEKEWIEENEPRGNVQ